MSLRPHYDTPTNAVNVQRPEIQHPRPTRPTEPQRRVTIATETGDQTPLWLQPATAVAALDGENPQDNEGRIEIALNAQRSPSAPPATNRPPPAPPTTIHPILNIRSALRSHSRARFTWDVRFSPDAPPPSNRRDSIVSNSPTSTTGSQKSTGTPRRPRTRPRANTQPADLGSDLELASDMHARLNLNYNSHHIPGTVASESELEPEKGYGQIFADHPMAAEPATNPPRARMLVVCRDLLPWLIPIYARDRAVGCTVLDVVRGIYGALQIKVGAAGHMRSASDGTRVEREQRRVDWLKDKTVFVCLGKDEALVRRRLPGRASLWDEVFVLMLARRRD